MNNYIFPIKRCILIINIILCSYGSAGTGTNVSQSTTNQTTNQTFVFEVNKGSSSTKSLQNLPSGKYYKKEGTILILGEWDGTNTFKPIIPFQTIDLSKSFPISLPFGILPTSAKLDESYFKDESGRWWKRWFNRTNGTVQEVELK